RSVGLNRLGSSFPPPHSTFVNVFGPKWTNAFVSISCQASCRAAGTGAKGGSGVPEFIMRKAAVAKAIIFGLGRAGRDPPSTARIIQRNAHFEPRIRTLFKQFAPESVNDWAI